MKSKQAAAVEIERLKKLVAIKDREIRRWKHPDISSTDLARFELKRIRKATREYLDRIRVLQGML